MRPIEEGSTITLDGWPVDIPNAGPAEPAITAGSSTDPASQDQTLRDESWEAGSFLPPAEPAPALANRGAVICKAVEPTAPRPNHRAHGLDSFGA